MGDDRSGSWPEMPSGDIAVLLERMNDPVFVVDVRQRIVFANRVFRELFDGDPTAPGGLSFEDAASTAIPPEMMKNIAEVLDAGGSRSMALDFIDRTYRAFLHGTPAGVTVLMSDVTEEEETRKSLRFKEKFESLLVSIATNFIEMRGTALNLGINDALLSIGVALRMDRAFLFQFSDDQNSMTNTHEWCATNIPPFMDRLQDIRTGDLPWLMNRLHLHETVQVVSLSELPEWAEAEREFLQDMDVLSLVAVPIVHGSELVGLLGFESVNQTRMLTDDTVDLLRIVGDAIGNALERNRMEREMIDMYRRAEQEAQLNAVLLREVNHRVKNNLSEIIGLLYAQRRFSGGRYGDFVESLIGRIRGLATVHDMLSRSGWKPLGLTELARGIVEGAIQGVHESSQISASVSNSSIRVDSNQAHAMALILNELVRNSIKHALSETGSLRIKVRMRKDRRGSVNLTYSDDGPGYPEDVLRLEKKNLGLDLIQNLTAKNLHGRLTLINDGGATARIGFSLLAPGKREDEEER